MASQESPSFAASLTLLVDRGADATQVAAAVVGTFGEIDAALAPIVGPRGVAALYMRSLFLATTDHPWLAGAQGGNPTELDVTPLQSVLARQGSAEAATGGGAVLQTFHDLLASLVGSSLTERLLRSVWTHLSSDPSVQDPSP